MIRKRLRRWGTILLTLAAVLSLATGTAFAATSDNFYVSGTNDQIHISWTSSYDGSSKVTDSSGEVTVVAQSASWTGKGGATVTVTIKNTSGVTGNIGFTATISGRNGGCSLTSSGTYETGDLPSNGTYVITLTGVSSALASDSQLILSRFTFTPVSGGATVTPTFDTTLGKVTSGGTALTSGVQASVDIANGLVAVPNSGVVCAGWIDTATGEILTTEATYAPADGVTVAATAVFAKSTSPAWFKVGNYMFNDLNLADAQATAGSTKTIILMADGTLPSGSYTVSSGNTLLIPYDAANSLRTTAPECLETYTTPSAYRTLNMASGATITVNGALSVSGAQSANGTYAGCVTGPVGFIKMVEGSEITVNNGAFLYAWGYITGSGSVEVLSGGTVYENFQLMDWRGGNATSGMVDNKYGVFPMSQYYVQNVEVPMTLHAGAMENCYMSVKISYVGIQGSAIPFIGPNGMFNVTKDDGYIVKDYIEATDRLQIDVYSDVAMKTMSLSMKLSVIGEKTINSQNYELPINGNITVDVHSGTITITQDLAILPGCELTVRDGAICNLANGVNVYAYDLEQWGGYCDENNATHKPLVYAPGKTLAVKRELTDAKVQIDGKIMAEGGNLYTTTSGAQVFSTGNGDLQVSTPGTQTETYQATQTGNEITAWPAISIVPAILQNAKEENIPYDLGDTYRATVKTGDVNEAGTYSYVDGLWHGPKCLGVFEKDGSSATCTEAGYQRMTCTCPTPYSYLDLNAPVEALDHNWKQTSQQLASCTTDGYDEYTCQNAGCGITEKRNVVTAKGHTYGESSIVYTWTQTDGVWSCTATKTCTTDTSHVETVTGTVTEVTTPATCTEAGKTVYTATFADDDLTVQTKEIPINAGHILETVVIPPTCEEAGYTTEKCTRCDYSSKVEGSDVPATGHNYSSVVTAPTCEAQGYTTYTCANCGDSYKGDYTNATGHTEVVDAAVAATCTTTGLTEGKHCSVCNTVLVAQQVTNAFGHSYRVNKTVAPTCTTAGYTVYTCGTCGDTYNGDEVAALGHSYSSVVTKPTCTTAGYTTYTCGTCNHSYTGDEVAALGHKWNDGEETSAATCTADGSKLFRCQNTGCTETKTEPIAALGHSWGEATYTSPVEIEGGWSCTAERVCTRKCGASETETATDTEPVHTAPSCTAEGSDVYTFAFANEAFAEQTHTVTLAKVDHAYTGVVTPPTCTAAGYTTYTCGTCGDTYQADEVAAAGHKYVTVPGTAPTCTTTGLTDGEQCSVCQEWKTKQTTIAALGHTYGGWTVTTHATCIADGVRERECSKCAEGTEGHVDTEVIPKTGHSYKHTVVAPTCTADGYTLHECTNTDKNTGDPCGDRYQDTPVQSAGHSYTSVVTKPTCTEEGYTTHTCTVCGDVKVDTPVEKLPHVFAEANYVSNNDATCTEDGTKTAKCDNCTATKTVADEGSAKGHSFTNYLSNNDATCTADGTKTATCDRNCGKTDTVTDEGTKLEHSFTNYLSNNDATCFKDGTKTAKCDRCEATDTVTASGTKLTHTYTNYVYNNDATCTEDGTKTASCDHNCGTEDTVTAEGTELGHSFGDWVIETPATCENVGSKYHTCTRETAGGTACGHKETEAIAATGHTYDAVVTPPTCEKGGYTTYTCKNGCGNSYTGNETAAKGHSWGTPSYDWTPVEGGYSCTGKKVCGNDETHVVTETATVTVVVKDATCDGIGSRTYTASFGSENGFTAQPKVETIPATGHEYGEAEYVWTGFTSCVAVKTCTHVNGGKPCEDTLSVSATMSSKETKPTCTADGQVVYTADFKEEDGYVDQTKTKTAQDDASLKATNHAGTTTASAQKNASCESSGLKAYWYCEACETYFSDAKYTVIGEQEAFDAWCQGDGLIPATGHENVTKTERQDPSCTKDGLAAYWRCDDCGAYLSAYTSAKVYTKISDFAAWKNDGGLIPATGHTEVTVSGTAATCTTTGLTDGVQCGVCQAWITPQEVIPVLGHQYTTVYAWEQDGEDWYCAATKTCANDSAHDVSERVKGTVTVSVAPGCETKGSKTYSAVFSEGSGFDAQTKTVEIDATGHDYGEVSYVWGEGHVTCTATRTCANNSEHVLVVTLTSQSISSETTPATCEKDGFVVYTADFSAEQEAAGYKDQEDKAVLPSLGHQWNAGEITTPATCTVDGEKTYTCIRDNCGATKTEKIDATGHDYDAVVTAPTCTEEGYTTYTCHCGDTYTSDEVDALGHAWGVWNTTTEPTCEDKGEQTRVCTRVVNGVDCGETETAEIDKLGHAYDYDNGVVTQPTCTEKGYTTYTCTRVVGGKVCGDTITDHETPAAGHKYGEWYIEEGNEATCEKKGERRRDCIVCAHYETESIAATGHSWGDWVTTKEKTCTEDGEEARECSVCHEVETKVIPAAHTYDEEKVIKAPTCTETGLAAGAYCDKCGYVDESVEEQVLPALGHSFTGYAYDNNATCLSHGTETAKCDRCGETDTRNRTEGALGHDYQIIVTDPTCTAQGYTTYKCSRCDDSYVDSYTDALGHDMPAEWTRVSDPTCEDAGLEEKVCQRDGCGHTVTQSVDKLGHDYQEIVTDPTCTTDGYTTAVCQRAGCAYSYVVPNSTVAAIGHAWGEPAYVWNGYTVCSATRTCGHDADHVETEKASISSQTVKEAVCEEAGSRIHTATFKNSAFEVQTATETLPAIGHAWGEVTVDWSDDYATCTSARTCGNDSAHVETETVESGKVVTAATCKAGGQTVYTAVFANSAFAERTVTIKSDPLTHHYVVGEVVEPTCTAGGYTVYVCDQPNGQGGTCGDSYQADQTQQLGHDYDHVVTQPTCTTEGYTTHTCKRDGCGYSYTSDTVTALGHSFTKFESNGDATCLNDGTETAKCDRCNETKTQTDAGSALGHSFTKFVSNNNATCLNDGTETAKCDRCDETKTQTAVGSQLNHSYSEWVQTKAPTCTAAGEEQRNCVNGCNQIQTRPVDKLDHTLPEVWTQTKAPTCYAAGEEQRGCSACDYVETQPVAKLQHSYSPEVTAPTCTAQGYTTYTCTQPNGEGGTCGDSYVADYVEATGHSWGEWGVKTEATCTEDGLERRECDKCDASETKPISAKGHSYNPVPTAPTCTEDGYVTYTCSACEDQYVTTQKDSALGHSFTKYKADGNATCVADGTKTAKCDRCDVTDTVADEGSKLGHSFTNYVSDGNATCTADGTKTAKCDRCDVTDTVADEDSKLPHSFSNYVSDGNATCIADGTKTAKCDRCDATDTKADAGSKLGHSYSNYVSDGNATCTADGTETAKCDRCTETHTRTAANSALGHSYGDWYVMDEASCAEPGQERRDCKRDGCGAYELNELPALDHSYKSEVTAPTCTERGYTTYTCQRDGCGHTYVDQGSYVGALGHNYEEEVTAPTCTEQGYTTYTCTRCDDSYTGNMVAANGHDYTDVVTDPTCTEKGFTTRTCSVCSHSYVGAEVPAKGHTAKVENEVPATCTADGLLAYWHCADCGTYFSAYSETEKVEIEDFDAWQKNTVENGGGKLPMLEHDFDAGVVTKPTCETDGYTTYTCQRTGCKYSYTADKVSATGHKYTAVVTDPTCTADGYTTYTCQNDNCGHSYTDNVVKATGHDWGEWAVVEGQAPTCAAAGLERRDCSKCDHYETNVLAATGHNYESVVTNPTCTETGHTTHTCSKCGSKYTTDVTDAIGHTYKSSVTAPTCTADGYTTYTCQRDGCGHTYVDQGSYVEALGHNYEGVVTEPTCTDQGYTTYTCTRCDDSYVGDRVAEMGHSYTNVLTPPTCEEDGYTTHTCSRCEDTYVDTIVKNTGHEYTVKVTNPTCTEDGYTTHTCGKCDDSYVDSVVEKLGHKRTMIPQKIPTCTEAGSSVGFKCSTCGTILVAPTVIEATGHNYGKVVTEPTCTEIGYTTYTCSSCGDHYVADEVEEKGHSYDAEVTEPTCTEGGYTTYTCSVCGDTYVGDKVEATGHSHKATVTEPTCTTRGYTTYICACGDSYVDEDSYVAALGHKFTKYVSNHNATCISDSTKTATCDRCDATDTVREEGTALGHSFTKYVSDNNATCEEDGTKTAVCSRDNCGATDSVKEEGTALGHSFTKYVSDGNATCTVDGTKTAECDRCDSHNTVLDEGSALGHNFTNYKSNGNATCEEDGTKTGKCARCGTLDTIVDEGSAKGHFFMEYVSDGNATCEADGTKTAQCAYCDDTDTVTDEGSAKGHSFTNYIPLGNATCEADGTKTAKCDRCDATDTVADEGTAKGHSFTNYVPDGNATCTADGTKTAKCDRCDATDTVTDEGSKLDHNFTNYVSDGNATCAADGTKTAKCDRCDATDTVADEGTAKGHNFTNYVSDGNATCAADGTKTAKCGRCDATDTVKDVGSKKEHTYTDDRDPDCNVCGYEREVAIPSVPMFRMYDPNSGEHFYTGSVEERDGLVAVGWNYEGVAFNFPVVGDPVHRLYNPVSGDHLYTMNEAEMNKLLSEGWNYEGVAFNSADSDQVPQYRVWNPNARRGAWHFTSSTEERDHLISLGWQYQGIGWYSEWV